jgi:molecular chaperone IbpA
MAEALKTETELLLKEDTVMTTFDFSPLFRTSVGYDRLASLLNSATRLDQGAGFPPYNIQRAGEDHYRITMAVAGFSEDELTITSENNKLLVTGEKPEEQESEDNAFLYRGIATRSFERRFNLAEHVKVTGARLDNGLLHIELEREIPEEMKPRKIEIHSSSPLLEGKPEKKAAA